MIITMIRARADTVTMVISRAQKDAVSKGKLIRGVLLFSEFTPHIFILYFFPSFRYLTVFTPTDTEEFRSLWFLFKSSTQLYYSAGKRNRGKKHPRPSPEPPVQWKAVLKIGFNFSWKLASTVIHDYVNFENRLSRKPTFQLIQNFIIILLLHTFSLQHMLS